jgi:UDP-N-acetylmuramoyl-tripeptide--D-alanyl-D-alanine ligase
VTRVAAVLTGAPAGVLQPARWHHGLAWVTVAVCALAAVPAGLRWLRVAQREHYLAGSVSRFAVRWWTIAPANLVLLGVALGAGALSVWWPIAGVAAALIVAVGPLGLTLRGRTSALAWTRRLRTLAAVGVVLEAAVVVVGALTGPASLVAVVAVLAVPLLVDLACLVTAPLEGRLGTHFVDTASARLARVSPTVVGITGSYGKTSTKGHVAHLVRPTRTVVATPASFNNRAGLARAINEHLADGTEVFVAEMGTYGPGEIADLCRWCPPDIAVITAIGPVHLERFGSEDRTVEAKSEILVDAGIVVLQVDDPRLAALADQAEAQGKRVYRCSSRDRSADVSVIRTADGARMSVWVAGRLLAEDVEVPTGVHPSNLACALAVALALGAEPTALVPRLAGLPSVDHRLQAARAPSGVMVLDDTYNANPAGSTEALAALEATADSIERSGQSGPHRRVVVTPGLVELGRRQFEENRRLGQAIAAAADHLVLVGRTNRRALSAGVALAPVGALRVTEVRHRVEAVEWVRTHLTSGDVVLYENDLPDHYP